MAVETRGSRPKREMGFARVTLVSGADAALALHL